MKQNVHVKFHSEALLEELEARQLFSGGIEGILAENNEPEAAVYMDVSVESDLIESPDSIAEITENSIRQELVFIDTDVDNYQELLNDILSQSDEERHVEVILLDNQSDGIEQITDTLADFQNLDAVHLISHGSDGSVEIGNTTLDAETLNQNLLEISGWSDAFTAEGDFLIYGCNLAATEDGQSLVESLSTLTLTDVAASDDLTGQAELGGNWELEYNTGTIEADAAVSTDLQASYEAILATETVADDLSTGGFTGNTGSQSWAADWVDVDGAGAGASTGNVVISGGEISIRLAGSSIAREVDLSAATSATFSFDYHTGAGIDAADPDSMVIEVSNDGGSTWNTLEDINYLDGVNSGSKSYDISAYTAVDTQIRFRANNGYGGGDEFFYADNVQIGYTTNTAPVITSDGSGATASINVVENNTAATTVTATDVDGDIPTFDITGGADQALFSIDTNSGVLTFSSAPNYEAYADFNSDNVYEVTVQSDDGNGGTDSQALSVTVIDINDAPAIIANSVNPTYTEGGAAVSLYSFVSPQTYDSSQTIEELVFTITNISDGGNELINLDGSIFALTDLTSGTTATNGYGYSVSLSGTTATLTLTTTGASITDIANLFISLSYENSSIIPTTLDRVFTITSIKDSGGTANGGIDTSSPNLVSTVTIVAINNAPTAANNTITTNEDTPYTFSTTDFNFSDLNGDTLVSIEITTLETVGVLQLSGVDVTVNQIISKADIDTGKLKFVPIANANGTGYDSFGFSVNDGTADSTAKPF